MTTISTQALYNSYLSLQTTSQFPKHLHSLGYTSVMLCLSRIEAMCSAFWSAEGEALHSAEHYGPLKTRLYHSTGHCGPLKARLKTIAKSQIFLPFFYIKIMNCCFARYARCAAIIIIIIIMSKQCQMYVYSGHALNYTKLVHRHATQTEGNKYFK